MTTLAQELAIQTNEPEIGDYYVTHKSQAEGWVVEKVPNTTGTIRIRLFRADLTTRWTTWVPQNVELD